MEFSQPYMRRQGHTGRREILDPHMRGYHDRLDDVVDVGADIFRYLQVDVGEALEQVGDKQTILGNVKPAQTLFSGTPDDVRAESLQCIQKSGGRAYILGAGCDIAPGTPLNNVEVWKEVVCQ